MHKVQVSHWSCTSLHLLTKLLCLVEKCELLKPSPNWNTSLKYENSNQHEKWKLLIKWVNDVLMSSEDYYGFHLFIFTNGWRFYAHMWKLPRHRGMYSQIYILYLYQVIACGVHHSSWRWLELWDCFHVWILLFFGLFCLFFFGGGNDFPINYLLLSMIGVYILGFGLVLSCIRGSSDCITGNNFFSSSVCPIQLDCHDQLAIF